MTAYHYLYLFAVGLVIIGWGARVYADDNVTIYGETAPSASTTAATSSSTTTSHASHHRTKKSSVAEKKPATESGAGKTTATSLTTTAATGTASTGTTHHASTTSKRRHHTTSSTAVVIPAHPDAATTLATPPPVTTSLPTTPTPEPVTVTKSTSTSSSPTQTQITISAPSPPPSSGATIVSDKPEVETGLPVARPGSKNYTAPHASYLGGSTATATTYGRQKDVLDNFTFTNFEHHSKNIYPWKINIITTIFWIGEGSTPISSTDNVASAWDQDWRSNNGGTDSPNNRDGFAPANHAARINPFYVALPFNDLAFPDKARRWLPAGWYRAPRDGKQVSACKDRWVEIKNAQGDVCYAQWEDVGPLRYDHAEYVFGDERPETYTRAGLDVSPAVADYLNINERNRITRWRFVDDGDVLPGAWLKYDEEAVLFEAIRNNKDVLPIERARAPINDQDDLDASQRKVSKAKG
jgi:hypothetical protein